MVIVCPLAISVEPPVTTVDSGGPGQAGPADSGNALQALVSRLRHGAGPVARLEELRLAAIEDRIETDLQLGRGAELAPEAEELATAHPLRERLRGQLMRIRYLARRQGDALKVYEDTRRLLADRLGVDPSPALSAVHLAILRADPGLGQPAGNGTAPAPGPSVYLPPRISNLPAQLTSFVGRDEELNRLSKLLAESRLVILTGPGGTGKTRLAIEASARIADQMPDGAWFVPLAPVGDALVVPQAVLSAIGAPEAVWVADGDPVRVVLPPLDRLADMLATRQLVLVLDNCEHLIGAVARLAGGVLAEAPGVRILAQPGVSSRIGSPRCQAAMSSTASSNQWLMMRAVT